MASDIEKLNEIYEYIRRINSKVILLKLITQAKNEYDKCDYESGRRSLIQAFFINRKNPVVFRGLGCISQYYGKYNAAVRFFKKALRYSEKKEIEYTLIGMNYYIQDYLEDAVEYFNLAIDENDDYDYAHEGKNQAMLEYHLRVADLQDSLRKYF